MLLNDIFCNNASESKWNRNGGYCTHAENIKLLIFERKNVQEIWSSVGKL